MAWFGRITDFKSTDQIYIDVDYFSDANPKKTISRRVTLPLGTGKTTVLQAIKDLGAEVQSTNTLNTQADLIGKTVPIDP